MGPKDLGYGTIMLAAAVLQNGFESQWDWGEGYTSFNSMATIQIVPQSRSGMLFMLLLYTSFVLPFCLCPSFPPNITKHGFSWRFQLGSGMMSSRPALCGHHKDILPGASSEGELGCWIPFSWCHKATRFSFVQIRVCLGEVKCLHLIVIGIDWRLLKSPGGMKGKLTQGDYPLHWVQLNVEGCLRLVNSGGGARPLPFSPAGWAYLDSTCSACREAWKSLLANNWGLKGTNEDWMVGLLRVTISTLR